MILHIFLMKAFSESGVEKDEKMGKPKRSRSERLEKNKYFTISPEKTLSAPTEPWYSS